MTRIYPVTPWAVSGSTQFAGFKVVDANGRSVAALPSNSKRPAAEREAAAHIISAAPELLALAIKMERFISANGGDDAYHDTDGGWLSQLRAAIVKATREELNPPAAESPAVEAWLAQRPSLAATWVYVADGLQKSAYAAPAVHRGTVADFVRAHPELSVVDLAKLERLPLIAPEQVTLANAKDGACFWTVALIGDPVSIDDARANAGGRAVTP